jgi:hypothetical protein
MRGARIGIRPSARSEHNPFEVDNMKIRNVLRSAALALLIGLPVLGSPAHAQSHGGGGGGHAGGNGGGGHYAGGGSGHYGGGGGWRGGGWRGGGPGWWGVGLGLGLGWGLGETYPYGYYPYDAYDYPYVAPPVVVAPVAPMQLQGAAPVGASWYYCDSAQGYYPYVTQCAEPWRSVPAVPSGAPR